RGIDGAQVIAGGSGPAPAAAAREAGERGLLTRDGAAPPQLPNAEREAKAVAALYGARASTGAEPTEAWFRQHAPEADLIHLATHGFLHRVRAMNSGVLLAVPERAPKEGETDNDGAL